MIYNRTTLRQRALPLLPNQGPVKCTLRPANSMGPPRNYNDTLRACWYWNLGIRAGKRDTAIEDHISPSAIVGPPMEAISILSAWYILKEFRPPQISE